MLNKLNALKHNLKKETDKVKLELDKKKVKENERETAPVKNPFHIPIKKEKRRGTC